MDKKTYEAKMVYRVWYDGIKKEAFFTCKEDAQAFAQLVGGNVNIYSWEMKIEE